MTHIGYIASNQFDRYVIDDNPKLVHQGTCTVQVTSVEYAFGSIRFSMRFESSMFSLDGFFVEAYYENEKVRFSPPGMITLSDALFTWLESSYGELIKQLPEMHKKEQEEKNQMSYSYHKKCVEEYEAKEKNERSK